MRMLLILVVLCCVQVWGSVGATEDVFLSWLLRGPQTLVWLPTMHQLAAAESGRKLDALLETPFSAKYLSFLIFLFACLCLFYDNGDLSYFLIHWWCHYVMASKPGQKYRICFRSTGAYWSRVLVLYKFCFGILFNCI